MEEDINNGVIDILIEIAEKYQIIGDKGRNVAYGKAADSISELDEDIQHLTFEELQDIKFVGPSIAKDIIEFFATGMITRLEELKDMDLDILFYLKIFGVGPDAATKLVKKGYKGTIEDLLRAQENNEFNETQLKGIKYMFTSELKIPKILMDKIRKILANKLRHLPAKWEMVGSYRRNAPASGDIDILFTNEVTLDEIIDELDPLIIETLTIGKQKFNGIFQLDKQHNPRRIDIRIVDKKIWGAALLHSTGSANFNKWMRNIAKSKSMTLSEYGLKSKQGNIDASTEESIFEALDLDYVDPVDRK